MAGTEAAATAAAVVAAAAVDNQWDDEWMDGTRGGMAGLCFTSQSAWNEFAGELAHAHYYMCVCDERAAPALYRQLYIYV